MSAFMIFLISIPVMALVFYIECEIVNYYAIKRILDRELRDRDLIERSKSERYKKAV